MPGSGTGDINVLVDLPAGGTATFTIDATVVAGATGILTNTATVAAPSGVTDTDPSNDSATDDSTLSPTADLVITKSDGAVTSVPGTSISYTITATNSGPSDVFGGEIADRLPAELLNGTWSCTAASGASCGAASGVGNVNVDVDVPVGGTITVVVTADIAPGATGLLVNSATISTPTGVTDANPVDNSATDTNDLDPTADLSITKTDALTGALPGRHDHVHDRRRQRRARRRSSAPRSPTRFRQSSRTSAGSCSATGRLCMRRWWRDRRHREHGRPRRRRERDLHGHRRRRRLA